MCLLGATVLLAPAVAQSATRGFKTGRYVGRTSQHSRFVLGIARMSDCAGPAYGKLVYCIGTDVQPLLTLKCPSGTPEKAYLDFSSSLNAKGILNYHAIGAEPAHVYLEVSHDGTVTGTMELKEADPDSTTGGVCSSGTVRFTAKR